MLLRQWSFRVFVALGCVASPWWAWAGPKEDFESLEEAMEVALDEYGNHPATEGTARAARMDPRLDVLAKMDALAEAAASSADGAEIAVRTFLWSARLELDREKLLDRFDRIAVHHARSEATMEAIEVVPDVYKFAATPERWANSVRRIVDKTDQSVIRLGALQALGLVLLNAGKLAPAKAAFEEIIQANASSDEARIAKGYVFEIDHLQVGMSAPDFTAKTVEGREISLKSLRGKVVLLDFWASWCGPCLAETPHLKAAAERFKDKPFVIVGVSLDDFKEMLVATVEQKGLPGIQTWDEKGRDNPVGELYNVQDLPQWYIIDAEGVIRVRNAFGESLVSSIETVMAKR